jgi:hypothetical protein
MATAASKRKSSNGLLIEKAQTALPAPGSPNMFSLAGSSKPSPIQNSANYSKRGEYKIYYDMYVAHPVVRAAIDKKAQYMVSGGFHFLPSETTEKLSDRKEQILKRFFRKSNAQALLRLTYRDLDIFGEAFWVIVRSTAAARTPMKAMRLEPMYMTPLVANGMLVGWRYGPVASSSDAIDYVWTRFFTSS